MFQFKWSDFAYTKLGSSAPYESLRSHPSSVRRLVFTSVLFISTFYLVISLLKASHNLVINNASEGTGPLKEGEIEFTLEHCGCRRRLFTNSSSNPDNIGVPFNQTTCGNDAYLRGSHQKIVGFSFYGDVNSDYSKKKGYFEGIIGNLELMPKFYPGWVMRLYYDLDQADPVLQDLCQLACTHSNIDICNAKHLPGNPFVDASRVFPMNWRFFPTLDPQVDVLLCRDLDSRFSHREVSAVQEWLQTKDKAIHAMRDNPAHRIGMLGASWGTDLRADNGRSRWAKSWKKMLSDPLTFASRSRKGPDQDILKKYIWNTWGKRSSVQHDSYLCEQFPGSIGFPTQRLMEPNNYIASVVKERDLMKKRCPVKCRRHEDWIYC